MVQSEQMTTTINTQKGNILLVEVPMEAYGFHLLNDDAVSELQYFTKTRKATQILEGGKFSAIGLITNGKADGFDVEPYVDKIDKDGKDYFLDYDSEPPMNWFETAQYSFNSLCASQGIEVKDKKWVVLK